MKWSAANARGDELPKLDGPTIEPKRQNVETGDPEEVEIDADEVKKTEEATPQPKEGEQATAFNLDRSDPADVKIYNDLRFGRDVSLLIEGRCNSTGAKGATDREGDLDVIIGQKTVKVATLRKPAGADWVEGA